MNAYLIHLIVREQKKREKIEQLTRKKQMRSNINGPDDLDYTMARGLAKADVDMENLIEALKLKFWN